jgi:hypothetical protein
MSANSRNAGRPPSIPNASRDPSAEHDLSPGETDSDTPRGLFTHHVVHRDPPTSATSAIVADDNVGLLLYHWTSLSSRRQSTTSAKPATASDFPQPKSLELEQRLARLEVLVRELVDKVNHLTARTITLQAHVDHIDARLSGR